MVTLPSKESAMTTSAGKHTLQRMLISIFNRWMEGQACDDCQDSLFRRIQAGEYDFPIDEWNMISIEAKDLVSHLLVR